MEILFDVGLLPGLTMGFAMRVLLRAGLLGLGLLTQAAAAVAAPCPGPDCRAWMDSHLRMNDILTIGTHNSYKMPLSPAEQALLAARNPQAAANIDYGHRTLTEQLDAGARKLEIDVYHDPQGGRYVAPKGPALAGIPLEPGFVETLSKPGLKVFHIIDVDPHSHCLLFTACLAEIRRWSDAHPGHTPLLIMVNSKQGKSPMPGGIDALPFDEAAFDAFDREVRSVLPPAKLITPDLVQGTFPTLRDAVRAGNWPPLAAARGRIWMALDEPPPVVAVYRGTRRSLEGRVMFINTDEDSPAGAYMTLNDPVGQADRIAAAVAAGYIVRTRADADTAEARSNGTGRRDTALTGGAQYVSTDYIWPDIRWSDYQVHLPGGAVALCNIRRTGSTCAGQPVE